MNSNGGSQPAADQPAFRPGCGTTAKRDDLRRRHPILADDTGGEADEPAVSFVLEYDHRSDDGPSRVGPFPSREAAFTYGDSLNGPGWTAEYQAVPVYAPSPSAGQDTGQLRDGRQSCGCWQGMGRLDDRCHSYGLCRSQIRRDDATAQLIAERDQARAQVQRIDETVDRWRDQHSRCDCGTDHLLRELGWALDGPPHGDRP